MKHFIIASTLGLLLAVSAQAQTTTPQVDTRQRAQRVRIAEGRKSGDLTRREAALLNKQQRNIRRTEKVVKADGEVTNGEKALLHKKQQRANRTIRRAKNNNAQRPY